MGFIANLVGWLHSTPEEKEFKRNLRILQSSSSSFVELDFCYPSNVDRLAASGYPECEFLWSEEPFGNAPACSHYRFYL